MSSETAPSTSDDADADEDHSQQPVKQSCCGSLLRDTHWKCLTLTLIIWLCLSFVIWCQVSVRRQVIVDFYRKPSRFEVSRSSCEDGYHYIPMAFAIMFYLIYLVECWNCHTRVELTHKVDATSVYDHVKKMQEALPFVWWKVISYHYIRRTRQVTRYRNGDAFTSTQVYYERVNTFTTGSAYNFAASGCRDISNRLTGLEHFPATKIRFSKGFSFQCSAAEMEFEGQRSDFFHENEARDDYMECREGMDLMNMRPPEYVIAMCDSRRAPWYLSHCFFIVASLLLLSWPIRVIIEYKTAYLHYHIHKVFGDNYVEHDPPTSRMPHAHRRPVSISSAELDYYISSNLMQLPSYSEALLMPLPEREQQLDNEGLLIANRLCRSSTTSSWQWKRLLGSRRRTSVISAPGEQDPLVTTIPEMSQSGSSGHLVRQIRNLSPKFVKQLRRNTSDSVISRHCAPRDLTRDLTLNNISTIAEHTNAEEGDPDAHRLTQPHPFHLPNGCNSSEPPPGYEEALFLTKVPVGLGHIRRSISRQFQSVTRSRSAAVISCAVSRGLRRLSRSRSDYHCFQNTEDTSTTELPDAADVPPSPPLPPPPPLLNGVTTSIHYTARNEEVALNNPSFV